ncbi:hypothetical protein TWF106_009596 [Orbilia oligospora]|uniref:Uncharacterized protein n=1 Tax=Orbilia oligospora TaxID=2813651 RepID=A0A7C8PMV2_ORBOL|nr:hypothetical protein TWF788_001297 [Orbilia oligospora]KAF3213020.1 hypothetical protein TWF106_009596 [Orbilia oligospora]
MGSYEVQRQAQCIGSHANCNSPTQIKVSHHSYSRQSRTYFGFRLEADHKQFRTVQMISKNLGVAGRHTSIVADMIVTKRWAHRSAESQEPRDLELPRDGDDNHINNLFSRCRIRTISMQSRGSSFKALPGSMSG